MLISFAAIRAYLWVWPEADLNIGPYNVHHLFTGTLLLAFGGIAGFVSGIAGRTRDVADVIFGLGLALTLDEWVYLIVTDGSNAAYWTWPSVLGAVVAIACGWCALQLARDSIHTSAAGGHTVDRGRHSHMASRGYFL